MVPIYVWYRIDDMNKLYFRYQKKDQGSSLTHLPLDNMAAVSQAIFLDAFSWMKHFFYFDGNFTEVCS